jgi:hypothetical protein
MMVVVVHPTVRRVPSGSAGTEQQQAYPQLPGVVLTHAILVQRALRAQYRAARW